MGSVSEKRYHRPGEEIAHSVTHGIGALLAVAGLVVLTTLAALSGEAVHVVSSVVFGTTLVILYSASTLYHAVSSPRVKMVLRVIDHSSIFLLIAGTYTPFTLISLSGPWGWTLFGIIWGLAALGIIAQFFRLGRSNLFQIILYLTMGWAALAAVGPIIRAVPPAGLTLMVAGGLAYTVGVVFYLTRRIPYHHAIWHLFVIAGSVLHFFAVLLSTIPPRT